MGKFFLEFYEALVAALANVGSGPVLRRIYELKGRRS